MHPYCNEQQQSTTSLQTREKWRLIFSQVKSGFHKKDLPSLPEGTHLSSFSYSPPALSALLHMLFDLPPPFQMTPSLSRLYNSSWAQATTAGPPLLNIVPLIITGMQGYQLHHPQPHSIPMTSGIILQFPTVPISLPASPHQSVMISPPSSVGTNQSGSLNQLQNQSLDHPVQSNLPGEISVSDVPTHASTSSARPWGTVMEAKQLAQTPPQSDSLRWNISTEYMEKVPMHP